MEKFLSKLKRILSSKILKFIILFLLQIILYIGVYHFLYNQINLIFGSVTVLSLILIFVIINMDTNPTFKTAWIILILLFPGIGSILYLYVNFDSFYKRIKRYYVKNRDNISKYIIENTPAHTTLNTYDPFIKGISNYAVNYCGYPIYKNTSSEYFKCGEDYYKRLLADLEKAKKFIFIEFFIIKNDYMWQNILNILIKKVKDGVEVRVMYDGFGSLITLPDGYDEYLERCGIKCTIYSKVKPFLMIYQNNRDHRKIIVIDGKIGYTGGINIADEYINKKVRFGYWKDTGIRLEGSAVNSLTMMFFELWDITKKKKTNYEKYFNDYKVKTDGLILPYADAPFDKTNLAEDIYLNIINNASKYVSITTPYLILDDYILKALDNAVKRGVEVSIIVPHIPDKKYVYNLATSHYKELVKKGVTIYEYKPGFIHAKSFLADDKVGVVGSINLDYRSLYLHFECGVLMYESSSLDELKKDMENTKKESILVDLKYIKSIPFYKKLLGRIIKIFSPLM